MPLTRTLTTALAVAMAAAAPGCGGGEEGPVVASVDVDGFEVAEGAPAPVGPELPDDATMAFDPAELRVPEGRVEFRFTNTGRIPHTFVIEARGFKLRAFDTGEMASGTVNLPEGSYFYYCDIEGHRRAGMQGALFVGEADQSGP